MRPLLRRSVATAVGIAAAIAALWSTAGAARAEPPRIAFAAAPASSPAADAPSPGPGPLQLVLPAGAPVLDKPQVVRFALRNPLVQAAEAEIEAMQAQLRKAKFAWIPVIQTQMSLFPGVNVRCDDVQLVDTAGQPFDFQWCRPPATEGGTSLDVQSVQGYFSQFAEAGVRFSFSADAIVPITTFGKLLQLRKLAAQGVDLAQLERVQVQQETLLRVEQAFVALQLARESLAILDEADRVVAKAQARVKADLGGDDFDVGAGNPARDPDDAARLKLAALELAQLRDDARRGEQLALRSLWALTGAAGPPVYDVATPALAMTATATGLASVDEYKAAARSGRPEARRASAAAAARAIQARLARAQLYPDLGFALSYRTTVSNATDAEMRELYYYDRFNFSSFAFGLVLSWAWDFHFKAFDLQRARALERGAAAERDGALLLLGLDVEQAYLGVVRAGAQIQRTQEGTTLAWQLVVSQEQRDTVGGGDAAKLLGALKDWYEWRFRGLEALAEHNVALAKLSRAVGTDLSVTGPGAAAPAPQPGSRGRRGPPEPAPSPSARSRAR